MIFLNEYIVCMNGVKLVQIVSWESFLFDKLTCAESHEDYQELQDELSRCIRTASLFWMHSAIQWQFPELRRPDLHGFR